MGYRNYIYVVEKEKAEAIRHKSYDELKKMTGEDYISYWDLNKCICAKEVVCLGKYLDFDVSPYTEPFFTDKKAHEDANEEMEFVLLNPKVLPAMATYYKNLVRKDWEEKIETYKTNPETGGALMFKSLEIKLGFTYDIDKVDENKFRLCDTWLWEYDLLNFVYLAKTLDFDKYYLLWRGY